MVDFNKASLELYFWATTNPVAKTALLFGSVAASVTGGAIATEFATKGSINPVQDVIAGVAAAGGALLVRSALRAGHHAPRHG